MFVNKDGVFYEPVAISDSARLVKSWMVRLIASDAFSKRVIGEEPFENKPSETQIMYCLAKYRTATFAVVEEVYKLVDDEEWQLPFN